MDTTFGKPMVPQWKSADLTVEIDFFPFKPVGTRGFEPRTSSLSATRTNQLSYVPKSSPNYDEGIS